MIVNISKEQNFNGNTDSLHQSSSYLERPRLLNLLEKAMDFPLVVVCAGSGYGKTRSVYSFLQKYNAPTMWVQINERDNAETRFWENCAHMVSLSWPKAGARIAEIGFPDTDEAFAKFITLTRNSALFPEKRIIVFDDFHLLHNSKILSFFERVINFIPKNVTVILISRTMPEIKMTGLMTYERIFTIREDYLRFTEDEIAEYFNQLMLAVTRKDIRDIFDDTLGWAFAVNLIGRSLRKNSKYERYALEAMKANIFKLIETEISQTVSEPLRRFLVRISLIDHLAASLIKELADNDLLVNEMELLNAYIYYDYYLGAYHIHHLFLDYLRQNQDILTNSEKRETYKKAGAWCENNNYHADALSYYEKSEDYNAVMQVVYSFDGQVPQDMARYALEIFNRIPKNIASEHPLFPSMDLKLKINLGMLNEAYALAEKYAAEYEKRPESALKNRALVGIYYAWGLLRLIMCPYTGTYDFDIYFKKMSEYGDKSSFKEYGPSMNQSLGSWIIIVGDSHSGEPEKFIDAVSRSVPYLSHSLNGNMYGFDDLAKGELCFFRHEINDAEKFLKQALYKALSKNQLDIQNRALFYLMRVALLRGDSAAAKSALKSMEELLNKKDYAIRYTTYDIACGFYYLALNRSEQVPNWLKEDFSTYGNSAFLENYANRVKTQYHYQTQQYSSLLAFIEKDYKQQVVLFGKISINVLKSLSLYKLNKREEAFIALSEAYDLAAPNNIITPFIYNGKDMRTLTAAAIKYDNCSIPAAWLENIKRKAAALAKKQAHMISEYKAINKFKENIYITKRETGILKELSQGLSRTEIAASQNISVNTVKAAITNIYNKLGANSLGEAVRIATELKLI